jgi:hypothetical protein
LQVVPKYVIKPFRSCVCHIFALGAFELITDEKKAGACLWITKRRGLEYWPTPMEETKYLVGSSSRKRPSFKVSTKIEFPQSFEKMIVHTLSHKFRSATRIVRAPLQLPIGPHQVLLKIIYAGVNASDVRSYYRLLCAKRFVVSLIVVHLTVFRFPIIISY